MKKKWVQLVLCLLLSAGIWLIHNLSQSYVNIVSAQVVAESNIDGRARTSLGDDTITAQIKTDGFRQLALAFKHRRPTRVSFDPADFVYEGGSSYSIPATLLLKYATAIYGEGVSIESVISQSARFTFAAESNKRVPVQKLLNISFKPQYMATGPMTFAPDSVTVYGEPARIKELEAVRTRPFSLLEVSGSVHGRVRLSAPQGLRLSSEEVLYSMEVSRYVELEKELKVGVRNLPPGAELVVLPSSVRLVVKCVFPPLADPFAGLEVFVDYQDFLHSRSGSCIAKLAGLPDGVIEYSIEPKVFDCLLKLSAER